MLDRTTRKSITFSRPFELAGVDEKFDAGTYEVETVEELIEGLSFVAYRRVATTIVMPAKILGSFARQVLTIDPKDLEVAIAADSQSGCSTWHQSYFLEPRFSPKLEVRAEKKVQDD